MTPQFVVVGRSTDEREPSLAVGPFDTFDRASAEIDALAAVTRGKYTILSLHTPTEAPA